MKHVLVLLLVVGIVSSDLCASPAPQVGPRTKVTLSPADCPVVLKIYNPATSGTDTINITCKASP